MKPFEPCSSQPKDEEEEKKPEEEAKKEEKSEGKLTKNKLSKINFLSALR